MFRDLKEYQTIQKIYEEQILKSPHEDLIIEAFQSEEFTVEEIDYVVKNIDQLCDENLLSEENNDLNEGLGKVVKTVVQKAAPKLVNTAQKASKAVASGVKAGVDKASPVVKNVASSASKKFGSALGKVKSGLSRASQAVSKQVDKAKPILKKGLDTAKKVVPAVGALAGAAAIGKKVISGRAAKAETGTKPAGAKATDTSEIESSEQSAKVEAKPKRRRVGSPMDELNPGAAKVKARFKAREAKGLRGIDGKPKDAPKLSGRERAQAMAKARIAAKKKASQTETKPSQTKPTGTTPTGTTPTGTTPTGTTPTGTNTKAKATSTGADTETKTNTKPNAETKTNTQIKKFPGSGKEIDPRAKVTQTTSTNDKGQKVTTTKTNLNLKGSEASDKIKEFKRKQQERRDNVNSMKEAYASIYNQPVESENLDEGVGALVGGYGAGKALGAAMAGVGAGGMLMQKIRRTKSKLNPDPDAGLGGDPEVGKVTTYTKNKKTGKYTKTTKRDKAGEQSAARNYRDPAGDPKMKEVTKDRVQSDVGPIKKTKKGYSILKKRREAAYDKKMERSAAKQRYQEIQQAAKPIKNVGTKNIQQDHYEYEPYDIVLEYLLSSEQAATIEEANYIMTEMDAETIQGIVSEGLPQIITGVKALKKSGIGGVKKGVKKVIKKLKGGEMKGDFPSKGGGPYTA